MKKVLMSILVGCIFTGTNNLVFADTVEGKTQHQSNHQALQSKCPEKQDNLQATMGKLWNDNLRYTHDYIMSTIEDISNKKDVVAKQLVKTHNEISDAIKPYYGDAASAKLNKLLNENIALTKNLVDAVKAKNNELLDNAQKKWDKNAEDIADYLSSINSYWSKTDLSDLLTKYIETTKDEVTAMVNKNHKDAVSYYDKSRMYISKFADTLAEGIKKQFPDKVKDGY